MSDPVTPSMLRAMNPGDILWDQARRAATLRTACWRLGKDDFVVKVVGEKVCVVRKPCEVCALCGLPRLEVQR
jgi:hypothetical protein